MDGYLLSAFIFLVVLYVLVWMRGMAPGSVELYYDEAAVAEYKQKVMLMFAKYGAGKPIDIGNMDGELVTAMFKDFLIIFNEFQARSNGKPVGMADVQSVFPLDFLNEYNGTMASQ